MSVLSDIACIYEIDMLKENEQLEEDLLSGRGMDVLFCIMDKITTRQEIATRLGMPNYSVQLYLKRLLKAGLIREETLPICNGQIEKKYSLASNDIEIINRIQGNSSAEKNRKTEIAAQHNTLMVKNAIRNANVNDEKPNSIQAYFIKAKKEDMEEFKKEIDKLFAKYREKEDLNAEETYSLFTVMAPGAGEV